MHTKLDIIRIKNMLDTIERFEGQLERLGKSEDPYLQELSKRFTSQIEEMQFELSMEIQPPG